MIEKIREILKKIFKIDYKEKLPESSGKTTYVKDNIRKNIKVEDNLKLLFLQKEYENGKIFETQLSNIQIKKLINLYENQIKELNYKLLIKRRI